MLRIALVLGVLVVLARPARAQDEGAAIVAYSGVGLALGSALANAALFGAFDLKVMREHRRPSLTHAVLEVVFSQMHLVAGTALFALGVDQGEPVFGGVGAGMMLLSLPPTIHGVWGLSVAHPDSTPEEDRRRRTIGGAVELSIALAELAGAAGAAIGFAYDPVKDVQRAGLITVGVLSAVPLALGAHGVYLLATRNRATRSAPPLTLSPSLLRGGALVSLVGDF